MSWDVIGATGEWAGALVVVATIIYALPPMTRIAMLALRGVPDDVPHELHLSKLYTRRACLAGVHVFSAVTAVWALAWVLLYFARVPDPILLGPVGCPKACPPRGSSKGPSGSPLGMLQPSMCRPTSGSLR